MNMATMWIVQKPDKTPWVAPWGTCGWPSKYSARRAYKEGWRRSGVVREQLAGVEIKKVSLVETRE